MLEKLRNDYQLLQQNNDKYYVPFLINFEYVEKFIKRYRLNLLNRREIFKKGKIEYIVVSDDGNITGNIELFDDNNLNLIINKNRDNGFVVTDYLNLYETGFDACLCETNEDDELCYIYFNDTGIVKVDGSIDAYNSFGISSHFKEACSALVKELYKSEKTEKKYIKKR